MRTGKIIFSALIFAIMAIVISGCEKSGNLPDGFKQNPPGSQSILSTGTLQTFGFNPNGCGANTIMELWMGVGNQNAGTRVGTVTFESVSENSGNVIFDLMGDLFPYLVTEIHIHFASDVEYIPQTKNGNPIPGQFEINIPVEPGKYQYIVENVNFEEFGAIHLTVAKFSKVEGFNYYLPDEVNVEIIQNPASGNMAYWQFKISGGGFISDYNSGLGAGVYAGWCIDVDRTMPTNTYPAKLFSSYENLPDWLKPSIEGWQNLDKVNYLVNHFAVGTPVIPLNSDCETASDIPVQLTYADIQVAIWKLVDNSLVINGLPSGYLNDLAAQKRVNAILCDVETNGEGFVPGCNEKIVFIVVPLKDNNPQPDFWQMVIGQTSIASIPVPCETETGTAWGDGKTGAGFPGAKQWGTYFQFCTQE